MEHLFIVNPAAGGVRRRVEALQERIETVMRSCDAPYEIYFTKCPMDACRKIREKAADGHALRVYACGGDGTLNECVNGAAGLSNVALTHYPCGTGNDYIKTFGEERALFFDLERLVHGFVHPVDLIECDDAHGERYSVNICSVGLDARVCNDVHKYSRLPLIGGKIAYVVALIVNMIKGPNIPLTVQAGGRTFEGKFALLCACNGQYYGGGFHPVPEARPDDGEMDSLIVREVSRLRFLKLVGKYASGRYREIKDGLVTGVRGGEVRIRSEQAFAVQIDGEVVFTKEITFRMAPEKLNMLFPAGMEYFNREREEQERMRRN